MSTKVCQRILNSIPTLGCALCTILELETCKVQALKTTNMVSLCLCKFHVFCLLWQGLQFRQTIVLCLPGRSVRIHNYPCLYQFSTLGCFTIFISYTLHNGIIIILELHLNFRISEFSWTQQFQEIFHNIFLIP